MTAVGVRSHRCESGGESRPENGRRTDAEESGSA
jgi:hypothetical protein